MFKQQSHACGHVRQAYLQRAALVPAAKEKDLAAESHFRIAVPVRKPILNTACDTRYRVRSTRRSRDIGWDGASCL
eukprot:scaffold189718_cov29-Tisochrysis_lutea.AAC.1